MQWLFGGSLARAQALVQSWAQAEPHTQDGALELSVWWPPGQGGTEADQHQALTLLANSLRRDTGRELRWVRLPAAQLPPGRFGLWMDETALPAGGHWLVPQAGAALPPPGARWWRAQPDLGRNWPGLAASWAEATCTVVQAALQAGPEVIRAQWPALLAALGRIRGSEGQEWQVTFPDPLGYGATRLWNVVETAAAAAPRVVQPQLRITPPTVTSRMQP